MKKKPSNIKMPIHQLETPKQLADRLNIPVSAIRKLINSRQLEHIFLSQSERNPKIPVGAWERFVEAKTIKPGQN